MEKWCEASADSALSCTHHVFLRTFDLTQSNYRYNTLHIDECLAVYDSDINSVLLTYCYRYKPDIIIFSFLGGQPTYNPSVECCVALKNMGIYLCFLWHDSNPFDFAFREKYYEVSNLHIIYDNAYKIIQDKPKYLKLFVPIDDETLFYPDEQSIDVSFIGSLREQSRRMLIFETKRRVPSLMLAGGERESGLNAGVYAKLIRSSKISLNYSYHAFGYWQIKCRVYEVLSSHSMLLETANPATRQLFKPQVDYIEYENVDDLEEKIKYFLTHEDERLAIAQNGYNAFKASYTAKHFWDAVLNRIEKDKSL